jgi:hypothetical protein
MSPYHMCQSENKIQRATFFGYDPLDRSIDSFRLCKLLPAKPSAPIQCILIHEPLLREDRSIGKVSFEGIGQSSSASVAIVSRGGSPFRKLLRIELLTSVDAVGLRGLGALAADLRIMALTAESAVCGCDGGHSKMA